MSRAGYSGLSLPWTSVGCYMPGDVSEGAILTWIYGNLTFSTSLNFFQVIRFIVPVCCLFFRHVLACLKLNPSKMKFLVCFPALLLFPPLILVSVQPTGLFSFSQIVIWLFVFFLFVLMLLLDLFKDIKI